MKSSKIKLEMLKAIEGIFLNILIVLFVTVPVFLWFTARWCNQVYGNIGFDAILLTLVSGLEGSNEELIQSYLKDAFLPAVAWSAIIIIVLVDLIRTIYVSEFFQNARFSLRLVLKLVPCMMAFIICMTVTTDAAVLVGVDEWFKTLFMQGSIFEEEYQDPKMTRIVFPEKKRNLIYICMESMETTFFSKAQGGGLDYNVIPNLYRLAEDNINFSQFDGIGGGNTIVGASWTMGSLVSQSSGIPLKLPQSVGGNSYGNYSSLLPGAIGITDILHEAGYYQSFMCGSDGDFAGRRKYYLQHGVDKIYDLSTIAEDGIVEEGYHDGWWGYQDRLLYEYARQELTKIADKGQPFSFMMLTVDTHHIGGNWRLDCCPSIYNERYENVYSCADNQIKLFLDWLSQQDFYNDTTIIITGDHPSMDSEYMSRTIASDYDRRIYNCFINSMIEPVQEKNREYSQVDMFPTTLAAIGCQIEGNRLGLGVNLFSELDTLTEKFGYEEFNKMLSLKSGIYDKRFLLGNSE